MLSEVVRPVLLLPVSLYTHTKSAADLVEVLDVPDMEVLVERRRRGARGRCHDVKPRQISVCMLEQYNAQCGQQPAGWRWRLAAFSAAGTIWWQCQDSAQLYFMWQAGTGSKMTLT